MRAVLFNGRRGLRNGRVIAAVSQGAACNCCGPVIPPGPCTCPDDPTKVVADCCCIPVGEAGSCMFDPVLCQAPCDPVIPPPGCICPGTMQVLPDCCCLPITNPSSCATSYATCAAPCSSPSSCPSPCSSVLCNGQLCCYGPSDGAYNISGSYRTKTCECSASVVYDTIAYGSLTVLGGYSYSSGSVSQIIKRYDSVTDSFVTTCTISGTGAGGLSTGTSPCGAGEIFAVGGRAGSTCSGPSFSVTAPSRKCCPSCYQDGPRPTFGSCASEGYPINGTTTVRVGCGGNSGNEQLNCEPCANGGGIFNEDIYHSSCRISMYDSQGSGLCQPFCARTFSEIRKCSVFYNGGCGSGPIPIPFSDGRTGIVVPSAVDVPARASGCSGCGNKGNLEWDGSTGGTLSREQPSTQPSSLILPSARDVRRFGAGRNSAEPVRAIRSPCNGIPGSGCASADRPCKKCRGTRQRVGV